MIVVVVLCLGHTRCSLAEKRKKDSSRFEIVETFAFEKLSSSMDRFESFYVSLEIEVVHFCCPLLLFFLPDVRVDKLNLRLLAVFFPSRMNESILGI